MYEFEFGWDLIIGTIICLFFAVLCAGSGIGGGCFYLVVFVLLLQIEPHEAIPLSKVCTFGVACGGFLILIWKTHPTVKYKTLVDYTIALMIEPLTIFGTILGVMFNIVSPSWLIIVFLILLLAYTSYKTFKKAMTAYKKENEAIKNENKGNDIKLDEIKEENNNNNKEEEEEINEIENNNDNEIKEVDDKIKVEEPVQGDAIFSEQNNGDFEFDDDIKINEENNIKKEKKKYIIKSIICVTTLVLVWISMFIFVLLRGGTAKSIIGIECGTIEYWVLTFGCLPIMIIVTAIVGVWLRRTTKDEVHTEGDIEWSVFNSILIPVGALFAGVSAAYLGIGGGMVIGPLLLEIGILPQVATATSAFMIMFTASSSSLQYIIAGKIDITIAIWYFFVGAFGAFFGQYAFSKVVAKLKRQSYISFFLGILIVLSTLAMLVVVIMELIEDIKNGSMWFNDLCLSTDYSSSDISNSIESTESFSEL